MNELTISDYIAVFKKHYRVVGWAVGLTMLLTPILCFVLPKRYESVASFMAMSNSSSGGLGQALTSMRNVPVLGNLAASISGDSGNRLWNIMNSYTVGARVIEQLQLDRVFYKDDWDEKRGVWKDPDDAPTTKQVFDHMIDKSIVAFEQDDKGLFMITVHWKDSQLAKAIADKYIESVQLFINESTFSLAKKNRLFLEEQIKQTYEQLKEAEMALGEFKKKTGVISLDAQTEMTMSTLADLESQIISTDMEMNMQRRQAGGHDNPEVQRLQKQKSALMNQMRVLTGADSGQGAAVKKLPKGVRSPVIDDKTGTSFFINLPNLPQLTTKYFDLQRTTMIKESVYSLLTEQFELARIEEIKEDIGFQIIDTPLAPKDPYFPKPLLFTILAMFFAFLMSTGVIFSLEYFSKNQTFKALRKVV